MKRDRVFTMVLIAFLLFACTKENGTEEQAPVRDALVTFQLKGSGDTDSSQTRAAGKGDGSDESTVSDLLIFFFDGIGRLVGGPRFKTGALNFNLKTTTAADSVYIIANTGVNASNYNSSIFKGVKNIVHLKGLQAVKGDLFEMPEFGSDTSDTSEPTQRTGHLWMSGMAGLDFSSGTTASPKIALKYIASKIVVNIIDGRINKGGVSNSITDNQVAVLFSGAKTTFFGMPNATPQTNYYTGINSASATSANQISVKEALSTPIISTPFKDASYHFYVFAQSGTAGATHTKPIIITIVSTKKLNGKTSTTYYPVHFDASDVLKNQPITTFQRGKLYTLTITLKGDISKGEGMGVPDPELSTGDADITLTPPTEWKTNPTIEIIIQ